MAILTNNGLPLRGSVGRYTFARHKDKIVVKEKITAKREPSRSEAQMQLRMRWGNIVSLWRKFEGDFRPYFEDKKQRSSDFNAFISANMSAQPVYMPKEVMQSGGCVVGGYQVSRGSLPTIETRVADGKCVSNIFLGELAIDLSTTVADFSQAVIEHNAAFADYDLLFLVKALQTVDSNGVPRVRVVTSTIVLDLCDTTPLSDLVPMNGFSNEGGYLGMEQQVDGAVAYIHGRRTKSRTLVSTQQLVVTCSKAAHYHSEQAFNTAVESYGGINNHTPKSDPEQCEPRRWTDISGDGLALTNKHLHHLEDSLAPPQIE